jgi:hypothetical protein
VSLRSTINGPLDRSALDRLSFPVAWSGTVSEADRRTQEADLRDLLQQAHDLLDINSDYDAVEVEDGVIVAVMMTDEEEEG